MTGPTYEKLGVSSSKKDVLAAARLQGEGLFPGAFCKLVPDLFGGDPEMCAALHSDGAGTKSVVAYLAYRETGDAAVFAGLAQDALVMNIDDLACVGALGPYVVSNTIGRHRALVPGEAIEAIVGGYETCVAALAEAGIEVALCGGETADLGDLVRTLVVDATAACRMPRASVLDGRAPRPGDVLIGIEGTGQASYEAEPNSGIGSNGLTLARHVLLEPGYRERYPESCAPDLPKELAYRGRFRLGDDVPGLEMSVGQALLSPTRSYAPILKKLLSEIPSALRAFVHCTGGGQTKCLRLPADVRFVKDNLFPLPSLFELLKTEGKLTLLETLEVFNSGHRMEVVADSEAASEIVDIARSFKLSAQIVGRCENRGDEQVPRLIIECGGERLEWA